MAAGRPREFDYDEALDQAMHVFWKKGYEGTSMPDLTDAMGMNKPSIYSSFGNKEELFKKALDRYLEKSQTAFRERLNAPTLRESLERLLSMAANAYACNENPKGCMAVQGALVGSDDSKGIREEVTRRRSEIVDLLVERMERALKENDLPKGTDIRGLASFYATVLHGMSVQSASGLCSQELQSIAFNAMKVLPV